MDKPTDSEATKAQPKISQKMLIRFAIGLFIVAALIGGYQWWKGYTQDPDLPRQAETVEMLAAIEYLDEGAQAVIFKDGEIVRSPDYSAGNTDKDLAWSPDGNRLFFVSDREEGVFNIYRWNPASNAVMRRSIGSRSQSTPVFPPPAAPQSSETALITSGGVVLELNPRTLSTLQVLPPVFKDRAVGAEGEGDAGQFDRFYSQLGTSFKTARWGKDKRYVAAVMRREDESEILILQDLQEASEPQVVISGAKIEVDVNPATGAFVFAVNGFRFHDPRQVPPDAMKDGKIILPFTSVVGMVEPGNPQSMAAILPTKDPTIGFQRMSVSPDGENLVMVAGTVDSNMNFEPRELIVLPARPGGGPEIKRIIEGRIFEPSWHPNSHTIAFVRTDEKNKRTIFTVNKDGSGLTDISQGKGDFAFPVFSPQVK